MPEQQEETVVKFAHDLPLRYSADIAVIGGGIAGVSAACAAALSGANVILIERFAVCGGVLTTGGVANFCDGDYLSGQGEVFDRMVDDLNNWGAIGYGKHSCFHREILAVVLQEMLLRRGVKLLLHTRVAGAITDGEGRVEMCVVCGKSGLEAVRAALFIDCSGEADLARYAGFETIKGGPPSGFQLPMSMMCFVRQADPADVKPHLPQDWFRPVRNEAELPMTSVWPDGPGANALKVKIPMFDSTDTESLTDAEITARRRIMEVLDYYQHVEKKPWLLDHCSAIIGIREGCRIVGDYVLNVEDLRAGRAFDDGVARGTYQLDGHKPDDERRTYILPPQERNVPPYQIPLRSLMARDGTNLMMAGRCFSADQLALSSARVATSGSMMGQAAGIAAALCVEKRCSPREIDPADVRRIVLERGGDLSV